MDLGGHKWTLWDINLLRSWFTSPEKYLKAGTFRQAVNTEEAACSRCGTGGLFVSFKNFPASFSESLSIHPLPTVIIAEGGETTWRTIPKLRRR